MAYEKYPVPEVLGARDEAVRRREDGEMARETALKHSDYSAKS